MFLQCNLTRGMLRGAKTISTPSFRDAPLGAGLGCAIAHRGIHTPDHG
jgi:hypothetical protein